MFKSYLLFRSKNRAGACLLLAFRYSKMQIDFIILEKAMKLVLGRIEKETR